LLPLSASFARGKRSFHAANTSVLAVVGKSSVAVAFPGKHTFSQTSHATSAEIDTGLLLSTLFGGVMVAVRSTSSS
jgi:hypothetical protein